MIFWFGNDRYDENLLIKYFAVEGFNSLIFFDQKVLNEYGEVPKRINSSVHFPVFRNSIVMVTHISAVFKDAVLVYEKYPKLTLKQIIPVVTREQILSEQQLPESVAVLEQDPDLIRILFERKKKITWFVKRLPKVMPYIFFYNFEHLILNPFGTFQINHDGTWSETDSLAELIDESGIKKKVGQRKTFFRKQLLNQMLFYKNDIAYKNQKKKVDEGFSAKEGHSYEPTRKEIMAWYNILSIYRGLYDFSQQLYGKHTTSSGSGKRRNRTDSGGRNKRPSADSQEIGESDKHGTGEIRGGNQGGEGYSRQDGVS
jgi:hypothetical protein